MRKILVVLGPTASGKTAFAVKLARLTGGEIISADSRQVYRGLDIGSGKDLAEYGEGPDRVPTHLLDIADPASPEPYTLADFMRDAKKAALDIFARGKQPVLCGGTGLYIHALIQGYELPGGPADRIFRNSVKELAPEQLRSMTGISGLVNGEEANPYRLSRRMEIGASDGLRAQAAGKMENVEFEVYGTYRPRAEIRDRIEKRLDARFREGMTDEIASLHASGVPWARLEAFGLEYKWISLYLQGKYSFEEMRENLLIKIRQFAKRQDTWFRKMEREGVNIHWISPEDVNFFKNFSEKTRI